jgi:TRAP-type C4-dicarboxylate transport system permease small subunit
MGKDTPSKKGLRWIDKGLKALIGFDFLVLFVLNMGQIISRSFLGVSSVLIPDISRFLFIWLVFLGAASIYMHRQHLVIEFLVTKLSVRLQQRLATMIQVFMAAFFLILIRYGWRIMMIRMDILYTGWEIPTGYAYLAVPVSATLMFVITIAHLLGLRRENSSYS